MATMMQRRASRCRDYYQRRIRAARSTRSELAAAVDWLRAEALRAEPDERQDVITDLIRRAEELNERRCGS